ncbi:hypothetical protein GGR56DRAFT_636793 [Xylariaceae sp. FL0804]|nr:hypothetical protein GGR56DRAFT_636793 [Xylariaceae sp. FL0804]
MVKERVPPKAAPLRPWGSNESNENQTHPTSQTDDKPQTTGDFIAANRPAVKASVYSGNMEDKYANLFIQPKSRPEHHRPQRVAGPLQPAYKDRKPAATPVFNTVPGPIGSASNPISVTDGPPISRYSQPGMYSDYVDPKKAAADIKALLEGSMEDEEEDIAKGANGQDKSQVEGLTVRLLPHQVEGVEWMKSREIGPVKQRAKVPKGGLLADDMGLGKTLQSIALLLTNPKPDDKHPGVEKTTLVVAPLALIRQWEAELKNRVSSSHRMKVLVHHGPQRTKRFEDLRRYDVVITTYQILVSEHGHSTATLHAGCFGLHWYRVILDEAHTIKNRNAKATKACYELRSVYRWCLSGTPMQNNLDELQSLVKFLRIAPYDNLREWRDHFDHPMKNGKGHIAFQRLHTILRCFMKRRTKDILKKAGALNDGSENKDGEEKATSSFKVTERKVVPITAQFSPAEQRFYDRLEKRTDKSLENMMRSKLNYASALVLLLRLRQACNHPKLVEGKLEKDRDALSEETRTKKNDTDVDALADLLGGLDVETKHCEICGFELEGDNRQPGSDKCKDCFTDLEYFKHHEEGGELKAPKTRPQTKKKIKAKVTKEATATKVTRKSRHRRAVIESDDEESEVGTQIRRRPKNRRAIIDSDDEEAEGDWIVSGDEQVPLRLGRAGGTDDENAEGEGETINSDDSEDDESRDDSRVDSFVVDDGNDTKPEDLRRAIEESDSEGDSEEDDLESISAMQKRLSRNKPSNSEASGEDADDAETESEDASEEDTGISESELDDSDSDSEEAANAFKPIRDAPHVLASAKIRQLIALLHAEAGEHKFIVFSQFTSMLDLVEPFLRKEGIKFARYDGKMRNEAREAALSQLRNEDTTRALLCSLRCGALGLNLTAASRVVILEPFWNPFVEEQAIDRVHRLTQTRDVAVYKLTVSGSVEERILALQDKKRLLAQEAIESAAAKGGKGKGKDAMKLGLQEMLGLFRPGRGGDAEEEDEDRLHEDSGLSSAAVQDVRGSALLMRSDRARKKEESAVYGRRW